MAPMARIVPMTANTTNRTTATGLRISTAATVPPFTSPDMHAPPVTAVLKGIRRRARAGGRRGSAAVSPAGMPAVAAASSAQVRDARAWPIRASNSSRSSRPCTNAALSRPVTRSRSACEARGPAAAGWAPGSGLTGASCLCSQRNPVSVRRPCPGAAVLPVRMVLDRLATPAPPRAGAAGPFISGLGRYPARMATLKITPVTAASPAPAPEAATVAEVITRLAAWLRRLPPPQERIGRLVAELEERFAGRTEPVTQDACAEIERAAWPYSRHLLLHYDRDGTGEPDEEDPGWPDPDPEAILPRAAQVRQVSRLEGGACLIRIDGFESLSIAQPYLDAAFALARGATGIVLDLRASTGGDPGTVACLAGRLPGGKAVPLSEVTCRGHRRQWWAPDLPAGTAGPPGTPVAVLASARTFSSAEALACHLQARGRVTVVGERTPGAADHVTDIRLAATVTGELPIGYCTDTVTGTSWEGRGVAPQVDCAADDAIDAALALPALKHR